MISLEQIQLLEKKVEQAVARITQLQSLNESLEAKCQELTENNNALKERIVSLEADQNKIEQGILKALDKLHAVENAVLSTGSELTKTGDAQSPVVENLQAQSNQNTNQENLNSSTIEEEVDNISDNDNFSDIEENPEEIVLPVENSVDFQENGTINQNSFDSINSINSINSIDSIDSIDDEIEDSDSFEGGMEISFDDIAEIGTSNIDNTTYAAPTPEKPYDIF